MSTEGIAEHGLIWKGRRYMIGDTVKFLPQNSPEKYTDLEKEMLGTLAKITGVEYDRSPDGTLWYINIKVTSHGTKYRYSGNDRWHPDWWRHLDDNRTKRWKQKM